MHESCRYDQSILEIRARILDLGPDSIYGKDTIENLL